MRAATTCPISCIPIHSTLPIVRRASNASMLARENERAENATESVMAISQAWIVLVVSSVELHVLACLFTR